MKLEPVAIHMYPSAASPDFYSTRTAVHRSPSVSSASDSAEDDATAENRPFACTFPGCTRRFKRKYTLKDHRFTTSGNLSRHRRCLHPWLDTPLPCLVDDCECEFPNDEKLQRHMLSHFEDSGDYRCEIGTCGRVFATVGNLRRHIKQNHGHTPQIKSVTMSSRPRRLAIAMQATPVQVAEVGGVLPAPLPFRPRKDHRLVADTELLDALLSLLDEEFVENL